MRVINAGGKPAPPEATLIIGDHCIRVFSGGDEVLETYVYEKVARWTYDDDGLIITTKKKGPNGKFVDGPVQKFKTQDGELISAEINKAALAIKEEKLKKKQEAGKEVKDKQGNFLHRAITVKDPISRWPLRKPAGKTEWEWVGRKDGGKEEKRSGSYELRVTPDGMELWPKVKDGKRLRRTAYKEMHKWVKTQDGFKVIVFDLATPRSAKGEFLIKTNPL